MRIQENKAISAARKSSKKQRVSNGGSAFTLDSTNEAAQMPSIQGAMPTQSVGSVSALMAVQGVDGDERRSQAINLGFDTLDALDALKIDVLSGQLSRQKLVHLANLVSEKRANLVDPGLMNILDHIELRARVELAKFEQAQR